MSHNPSDSAIQVNRALEDKLKDASFEELKVILANAAVQQQLVVPDIYDNSVLIPTALADNAPRKFARTVEIDGRKIIVEATDPVELERAVGDVYRTALQSAAPVQTQQPTQQTTEQPRDPNGRFVPAEPTVTDEQKAALALQFQLGQISTADYLEKTGAVAEYLEKQGVPLQDLQSSIAEKREATLISSWQDASAEFLKSPDAADWPGGPENLATAQKLIEANGLINEPSVQNLIDVFNHMKQHGLVAENPELTTRQKVSEANSFSEIHRALGGSGFFGV